MKLIADEKIAEGEYHGYDVTGALIVRKSYAPNLRWIIGTAADEDRVVEWRTSAEGRRRMAACMLWIAGGAKCEGMA